MVKSVKVGDIQLNYRITGEGKPIVLLHGYGFDSTSWQGISPHLENHYKIILPDFPGFGSSRELKGTVSIDILAQLVYEILVLEKINQIPIFGHSMGGYVALNILKLYPQKVVGLGLIHSHPFEDKEKKKREREKGIQFILKYGTARYARETLPFLFDEEYKTKNRNHLEEMIQNLADTSEEIIENYLRAMMNRLDTADILSNIPYPLFLQLGETDSTLPLEKGLETAILPEVCLLKILYGIGHMGLIEQSDLTAGNMREYLDQLEY